MAFSINTVAKRTQQALPYHFSACLPIRPQDIGLTLKEIYGSQIALDPITPFYAVQYMGIYSDTVLGDNNGDPITTNNTGETIDLDGGTFTITTEPIEAFVELWDGESNTKQIINLFFAPYQIQNVKGLRITSAPTNAAFNVYLGT